MRSIIYAAMLALATTTAGAAEVDYIVGHSANNILPSCKIFIDGGNSTATVDTASAYFYCYGVIDSLVLLSPVLRDSGTCFKLPDRVTIDQVAKIIVRYIEARPARADELFHYLALEALHDAWPCK
jgi:Rap1a immunity proteins